MAWKKGQSGNPLGPKSDKLWRQSLISALRARNPNTLQQIADVVVGMALEGDMKAIEEIANRLDGRARQQTELVGDEAGGPIRFIIERIGEDK